MPYIRTADKVPKAFEKKSTESVFYLQDAVLKGSRETASMSLYYLGRYYQLALLDGSAIAKMKDKEDFLHGLEVFLMKHYFSEDLKDFVQKNIIVEALSYGLRRKLSSEFFIKVFQSEENTNVLAYALAVGKDRFKEWDTELKKSRAGQVLFKNEAYALEKASLNQSLLKLAEILTEHCSFHVLAESQAVSRSSMNCLSVAGSFNVEYRRNILSFLEKYLTDLENTAGADTQLFLVAQSISLLKKTELIEIR